MVMFANTISWVDTRGHTYGRQLAGSGLFFVPRAVWSGKPEDTGVRVGQWMGLRMTNLSAPLWTEFWVDLGATGMIGGMALIGYASARTDRRYALAVTQGRSRPRECAGHRRAADRRIHLHPAARPAPPGGRGSWPSPRCALVAIATFRRAAGRASALTSSSRAGSAPAQPGHSDQSGDGPPQSEPGTAPRRRPGRPEDVAAREERHGGEREDDLDGERGARVEHPQGKESAGADRHRRVLAAGRREQLGGHRPGVAEELASGGLGAAGRARWPRGRRSPRGRRRARRWPGSGGARRRCAPRSGGPKEVAEVNSTLSGPNRVVAPRSAPTRRVADRAEAEDGQLAGRVADAELDGEALPEVAAPRHQGAAAAGFRRWRGGGGRRRAEARAARTGPRR